MTTPSEKLLLTIRYLDEARSQVEEAASHVSPYRRTARRQSIKEDLQAARELLEILERDDPGATTPYTLEDGEEVTATLPMVRATAYRTEAFLMWRCYDDYQTAHDLLERAVAILPEDGDLHLMLAATCGELRDYPAAIAAMERAISLEPGNVDYKHALNDLRRRAEQAREEALRTRKRSLSIGSQTEPRTGAQKGPQGSILLFGSALPSFRPGPCFR